MAGSHEVGGSSPPGSTSAGRRPFPSSLAREGRVDSNKVYAAIEAFVGEQFVVKAGERLRGSHPAVQTAPHLFVDDGAGDEEIAAARAAAFDRVVKMSEAESAPVPPPPIDPSTPLGELMVCVA